MEPVKTEDRIARRGAAVLPRAMEAWHAGWAAATTTWRAQGGNAGATYPGAASPGDGSSAAAPTWRARLRSRGNRRRIVATLAIIAVVITSCGLLNIQRGMDALAAARDAKAQIAEIQALAKGGGTTDPTRLRQMQVHLNSIADDLQRLQADIPATSVLASTPGTGGAIHLLRMGSDLVQAGQAAMPAVIVLAPHLKELASSLQTSTGAAAPPAPVGLAPAAPPAPPLTAESVRQAAADLERALPFVQAALAERASISDTDLRLLGLGKYLPVIHQIDALAPAFPHTFAALHAITAALPMLLGVGQPTNFVLFSLDSDELRPTGGFMGNYAQLTMDGGKLTSGVHLRDIYSVDCPLGREHCPSRPIPDQFAWMQVNPTHFGLRDSNLDPDYPVSARLAEQLLAQDGAPAVQGVFSITPHVIEQILQVTGPITVVPYCTVVSADTMRQVIHYYHLSTPLGISTFCPGPQTQSANRKAFDGELASTLMHRVAILPAAGQNALARLLLQDFLTRDIQLYFNDPGLEQALTGFGVDGAVQSPTGDSLYVVDTNTGGNYANGDVRQQLVDTVTLDAHGTATHDLTVTYTYPKLNHLYQDVYEAQNGYWTYRDVVRVIVPRGAQSIGQDGCDPLPTTEPGHSVWGCTFLLSQPQTVTLHFRWSVAHALTADASSSRYRLLIQHQAGSLPAISVTIHPPAGAQLTDTVAAPLVVGSDGQVSLTGDLRQDTTLQIAYSRS